MLLWSNGETIISKAKEQRDKLHGSVKYISYQAARDVVNNSWLFFSILSLRTELTIGLSIYNTLKN